MHRCARLFVLALLGTSLSPLASAAAAPGPDHPIVAGFERHAGKSDAALGQLLLGELNCLSCHSSSDAGLLRKQAPILDHVGGRVRVGWLRKFLRDPHDVKPGTTMPALLTGDAARDEKVEALVHFLASTGSPRQERPHTTAIGFGHDLYHKVGCVACHGPRDAGGKAEKTPANPVPLGDLTAKYTIASLAAFLEQPHQARPSGRMPKLLQGKEARDVATYLLQGIKGNFTGRGTTAFSYHEGSWGDIPDFGKMKPIASGLASGFDLGAARRGTDFGLRFEGFFLIEREGTFIFHTTSDDGSRLSINGKMVVDNGGIHAPQSKSGSVKLTKGVHKVVVDFIQAGGGAELAVHIESPGAGQHDLGDLVAATEEGLNKREKPKVDDEDAIDIDPQLVEKGKALFASTGCASCHLMQVAGKLLVSTRTGPALEKLKAEGGCLSATPAAGLPSFGLSAAQRDAIAAAIHAAGPVAVTPDAIIRRTMTAFNCYACHQRDKVGGPTDEVNRFFQTTQQEMGDEARVPPPLDGVGAKLKPDYLRQILDQGAHDRPYMVTHMPGFGNGNVGKLVEAFAAIDKLPPIPEVHFKEPIGRVKSAARRLVGGDAFGCIKCHTFAGHKAEGVQGIDMTLMPRRLKRDWFHAYIAEPQKIRPGTRMPSGFDKEGKSVLPNILDGTALQQIEAIWLYLQDGNPQLPLGAQRSSILLKPVKNAILYRNFIQGAGNRAIAVGYPEQTHLAFDANEMRLAMLWQGAFLDAARHWTDRGAGSEGPAGDNILHLHGGAAFAALASQEAPWPTGAPKSLGYRFLGYQLTPDDRPTFRYSFEGIEVEDFPNPVAGKEGDLRRTLSLTAEKPLDNVYFRAAVGSKIEKLPDGWFHIDGAWKVRIEGGEAAIRKAAGHEELVVPVRFADGKAKIVEEFVW
jgi:mono/diheme cytochrome c family protein